MPQYPVDTLANEIVTSSADRYRVDIQTKRPRLPSIAQQTYDRVREWQKSSMSQDSDVVNGKLTSPRLRPQLPPRHDSEERDKLQESLLSPTEKRRASSDRRRSRGLSLTPSVSPHPPRPDFLPPLYTLPTGQAASNGEGSPHPHQRVDNNGPEKVRDAAKNLAPLQIPHLDPSPFLDDDEDDDAGGLDQFALQEEYDRRWILNLSMHFRDSSNREKFFVTYAEKPNLWRRITISLDYRTPLPGSLEADVSTLHYQQDKSLRIFEAIRESLAEIQYYDTVTNLKLETSHDDGQLHVHVREDVNEIISFPPVSLFDHVCCPRFNESALDFDSHLSGFVYKVRLNDRVLIKKEIPGPDTVDEFLYEVNALDSLLNRSNVVQLEGLVTDDRGTLVKGLLISYAAQGSLVDLIYNSQGTDELPWHRREKWAKQIVTGLSNIHEAGFVQGDFTLSNIVIDDSDNAQIIDINRRGCPVGWEPPELARLIESGQRIGMCIGVKTDIYQLGMVLWALAENIDEPERVERPLRPVHEAIPSYFRDMVESCLSARPQGRSSAKDLLARFPESAGEASALKLPKIEFAPGSKVSSVSTTHRSDKEYIDPAMAVTIDDVKDRRRSSENASQFTVDQVKYVNPDSNPASSTYRFESSGSWVVGRQSRGRSPFSHRRRRSSPFGRTVSSATSFSEISPARHFEPSTCLDDRGFAKLTDIATLLSQPVHTLLGNGMAGQRADQPALSTMMSFPSLAVDKRLATAQDQNQLAHLLHKDSGFDEMMDELGLNDSHITEKAEPSSDQPGVGEEQGASSSATTLEHQP